MTEYIDRGSLVDYFKDTYGGGMEDNTCIFYQDVIRDVCEAPAADVAPVVHGKWVEYPRAHYFKCSNCKYTVPYRKATLLNGNREYNYCPNCGAKTDLEE